MPDGSPVPPLEPYQGLIAHKAARMSRQAGFSPSDAEDIAQELHLKALRSLPHHDQAKGDQQPFVRAVLERRSANLVRDRKAAKRHHSRHVSLSITAKNAEGDVCELSALVGERELGARTGKKSRSDSEVVGMRDDVLALIKQLDPEQQRIVRTLMQCSEAEAARRLKMPRTTLQRRIAKIREIFATAEMQSYLS